MFKSRISSYLSIHRCIYRIIVLQCKIGTSNEHISSNVKRSLHPSTVKITKKFIDVIFRENNPVVFRFDFVVEITFRLRRNLLNIIKKIYPESEKLDKTPLIGYNEESLV